MRRRQEGASKPVGGRPAPRRLFSFDSVRKERSTLEADDTPSDAGTLQSQMTLTVKPIAECSGDLHLDDERWTEKPLVTSPEPQDEGGEHVPDLRGKKGKVISRPAPLDLDKHTFRTTDSTDTPVGSPSKRRWQTVRHHVLPSVSSSVDSVLDSAGLPARSSTPRAQIFGQKKAFRQVVETAQTQQQGETRRFAEAIKVACWECRYAEAAQQTKTDREPTSTLGSSLYLPFANSTTSLQAPASSAASILSTGTRIHGLRRPPSMQTIIPPARLPISIVHIARALTSAMSLNRPRDLPHEKLVLSTLLVPFLSPLPGTSIENEQATAVETFEYTIRTWKATSIENEIERCIWCCKAASVYSSSRGRILGTLSSIIFSKDKTFTADSPSALQSLLQNLFSLAYLLSLSPRSSVEFRSVIGFVSAIRAGSCGPLSKSAVEKEYGVRFTSNDNDDLLREILVAESVIRCLSSGSERERRWVLRTLLQEYWPVLGSIARVTPLYACAQWRKLNTFLPAIRNLLSSSKANSDEDSVTIIAILRTRVFPELERVREEDAGQLRREAVRLTLELLHMQDGEQLSFVLSQLCDWLQYKPDWKADVQTTVQNIIADEPWPSILRIVPAFVSQLPDELQGLTLTTVLPLIYERMSLDPPSLPSASLSHFLESVSRAYPKIFYKPLFTCAAANKDATVVQQLMVLNALSKFMPDFWTRDPDMMSVALTSNVVAPKSSSTGEGSAANKPRIGQLVLTLELLERVRLACGIKDISATAAVTKFAASLETRLGVVIEARETTLPVAEPQRFLLCSLFRQIRLLTRSTKPANWLSSVISWVLSWKTQHEDQEGYAAATSTAPEIAIFQQLEAIYRATQTRDAVLRSKRKSTANTASVLERQASEKAGNTEGMEEFLKSRLNFMTQASRAFKAPFLNLLVTVSGMITDCSYLQLGPVLWRTCFSDTNADIIAPSCFLLMHFAEKDPGGFTSLVETDFQSAEPGVRRRALERIAILSTWRFQLLSQDVILDRNHRRPFRLQRPPVLFVATDIGSSTFVHEDDTEEYKDINGYVIPLELRRRLSEIGWAQEDRVIDHQLQRIRTPMSLLPTQQLDRMLSENADDVAAMELPSPSPSPEPSPSKSPSGNTSLWRQDSTSGNRFGGKRRPVFVPALLSLFPRIAFMINDSDFIVANAARSIIIDFMRDDPTLLSRHVFQLITGDNDSLVCAITTLRLFLHVRHTLPPGMAHHVLNHLTGLLKSTARHAESPDPLRSYAYALPSIAKLLPQVNKISLRELRRNKVDAFIIPSGSLWFPSTAPAGPMFPQSLPAEWNPFESVPPSLVSMVLIRTSQNLLFVNMLRRNPQDIKVIRKNISGFQLPSLSRTETEMNLSLKDMVPERTRLSASPRTSADCTVLALSLTLARSYVLLIQQMLQCMSRHLNDRNELAVLVDGLNRVLLTHKDDIGIISHVMLAYMIAATRFKRLFVSGGGYMLFMPAVVKVFVEAEQHIHVRQAIAYATERFYALHQESFVFQSFDALGPIFSYPASDSTWVADGLATLFISLRSGAAAFTSDAAGIHDMNKTQEKEALMVAMAEEVPQTFLASLRRPRGSQDTTALSLPTVEGYEGKRLKMDDLVRLLLTVIAHNPGIQRAEQFLMFLRALTPHLYGISRSVQTVLRSGVDALGGILLTRATGRQKGANAESMQSVEQSEYEAMVENAPGSHNSAPSSLLRMRLEFFHLVVAFLVAGGQVTPMTTARVVELVRSVMKDSRSSAPKVATFLTDLMRALLIREETTPDVKEVAAYLASLAPLCSTYIHVLDLSGIYEILHQVATNPVYASDLAFARLITQYCSIGLTACAKSASEDVLFTLPLRIPLIKLVVDALTMDGADIVAELEKRPLTHNFLGGVVLPIALSLRTSGDIVAESQWAEGGRRDLFSKTWLRLLNLALSACEKDIGAQSEKESPSPYHERRKSAEQDISDIIPPSVKTLCIALQVVKVIIIRAEEDISAASRGIWVQLGSAIKSLLADGDAMFALRTREYSEPPSPAFSPRTSTFGEPQSLFTFPSSVSMHGRSGFNSPRIIDYLVWSMIEWCWLRRSPLMIQMRIFAQERIASLAAELRLQGTAPLSSSSRASGRRFSSVFSKPRRSMYNPSAQSSAASTPRNSVYLTGSASFPPMNDSTAVSSSLTPSRSVDLRQAGYARMPSPISPSGRMAEESIGLKIVHLGPVDSSVGPSVAKPTSSAADTVETRVASAKSLAKEVFVSSHLLTTMTYKRIRIVQYLMGYYPALLPRPGSDYVTDDGMDFEAAAWSKNDALQAVVDETKELLDEFRESFGELGDESVVMVDSHPSLTSMQE